MNKKNTNNDLADILKAYWVTIVIVLLGIATLVVLLLVLRTSQETSNALITQQAQSAAQAQTIDALKEEQDSLQLTQTKAAASSPTSKPSPTGDVTNTPDMTNTPRTSSTATQYDKLTFLGDVTIPDQSLVLSGSTFTKTWALRNDGNYAWDAGYELVFLSGDLMGGELTIPIVPEGGYINPGEMFLASVELVAPMEPGKYTGFYKVRTPYGALLGVGPAGDKALYLVINSAPQYYFAENLCSAVWSNNDGLMYCPSEEFSADGYFVTKYDIVVENELILPGGSIVMSPPQRENGTIEARFEPVLIPHDGHFKARFGCVVGKTQCKVTAGVKYRVGGGQEFELAEVSEYYDGFVSDIDVFLPNLGLEGESVEFTLYVNTAGGHEEDTVFWWNPRIEP